MMSLRNRPHFARPSQGWLLALLLASLPHLSMAQTGGVKTSKRKSSAAPAATASPAETQATTPAAPTASTSPSGLPLFYNSVVAFDSVKHRDLSLPKQWTDFQYARRANVIPVLITEAAAALQHYPLVFIKDATSGAIHLVALVGAGDGVNQFVDSKGQWRADTYIPAWVRRYPFLMLSDDKQQAFLAFDPQAPMLNSPGNRDPLLDAEGKPTARLQQVIQFQKDYAAAAKLSEQVGQKLFDAGVLEAAHLNLQAPGRTEPLQLGGFMLVNEKKLRELPAAELEKLHSADALGLAYAQIFSMANLRKIRIPVTGSK